MLTVIDKEKDGRKVLYVCDDTSGHSRKLDKDELIVEIQNNNVSNARIQNYKGQLIIRLKDEMKNTPSTSNSTPRKRKNKEYLSDTVLALDIYKKIMKEFNIRQEEEELSIGFDRYELDEEIYTWDEQKITRLSYKMASDIRRLADIENNMILEKYKRAYMK